MTDEQRLAAIPDAELVRTVYRILDEPQYFGIVYRSDKAGDVTITVAGDMLDDAAALERIARAELTRAGFDGSEPITQIDIFPLTNIRTA